MFRGSYIFCMVLISVMVLGLLFGSSESDEDTKVRAALFPELKFKRNGISQIEISKIEISGALDDVRDEVGDEVGEGAGEGAGAGNAAADNAAEIKVTLLRQDGQWKVQERIDALADAAKINRFVAALVKANKLERKTFTPEYFYRVCVDDQAIGVKLEGQATIWIGATAKNRFGRYVRMIEGGESVVWLISSELTELSTDPADWLQGGQALR